MMALAPVESGERDPTVEMVAVVSLVAGLACTLAPGAAARLAGIGASPGVVRAIGITDLVLAAGLHAGRPSWAWMVARAATNPAIAGVALASRRSRRSRLLAAGLAIVTVTDLRTAKRLFENR
jgi:hypothetical protein